MINAWKTFSTRNAAQIESCFTEDAAWIFPAGNGTALALGRGGISRLDRHEIASFMVNDFGRLFIAGVEIQPIGICAEGDTVVMQHRFRATLANGRSYDNEYCFVFKVRDGRIAEMREYMDTLGGFRQIFGEDAVKSVAPVVGETAAGELQPA